jgi:hypothetical protein
MPDLEARGLFFEDNVEMCWELPITAMVDGSGEGWEEAVCFLIDEIGA